MVKCNTADAGFIQNLIRNLNDYLFELPTYTKRLAPKCKSTRSRSLCYDFLIELIRNDLDSYERLHNILLTNTRQKSCGKSTCDYWPLDEQRSIYGYVGLTNLGQSSRH